MKLKANQVAAFLKRPDPSVRFILVYGPDSGLVKERGNALAAGAVPDLNDPFAVADLDAGALVEDPVRLHDEMASLPMFGGRRLVRARGIGDGQIAAFQNLLEGAFAGDNLLVAEAGDLPGRSKLRALFEAHPKAVALPCYVEDEAALARSLPDLMREYGLTLERDAAEMLAAHLVGDRQVARRELEKLSAYMGPEVRAVTLDDVMAVLSDSAEAEVSGAVMAACSGEVLRTDRAILRLMAEGTNAVQLLRAASRHLQRLQVARAAVDNGSPPAMAIAGLRPPVFFKEQGAMEAQLRQWSMPRITAALDRLLTAEQQCKSTGWPSDAICSRMFLQLCQMARSARG